MIAKGITKFITADIYDLPNKFINHVDIINDNIISKAFNIMPWSL